MIFNLLNAYGSFRALPTDHVLAIAKQELNIPDPCVVKSSMTGFHSFHHGLPATPSSGNQNITSLSALAIILKRGLNSRTPILLLHGKVVIG